MLELHFEPEFFADLQVALTWYKIDIEISVLYLPPTDAVSNCFDSR